MGLCTGLGILWIDTFGGSIFRAAFVSNVVAIAFSTKCRRKYDQSRRCRRTEADGASELVRQSTPCWETIDSYHRYCNPPIIKCEMRKFRFPVGQVKVNFIVGFRIVIERRKVDLKRTPFRRDAARVASFEVRFDEYSGAIVKLLHGIRKMRYKL